MAGMRLPIVAIAVLLGGVVAGALRGSTAPVPSLAQGALAPVPVAAVIALLPMVALRWSWEGIPLPMLATGGSRSVVILMGTYVALPSLYAAAALPGGELGGLLESLRNANGLLGLALIGSVAAGEAGFLLAPIAFLLAAFLAGRPAGSATPSRWAWPLADGGDALALGCGVGLGIIGLLLTTAFPRTQLRHGD